MTYRQRAWAVLFLAGVLMAPADTATAFISAAPTIQVEVSNGYEFTRYTRSGWPQILGAIVTSRSHLPFSHDLYVGALVPGGGFVSMVGNPDAPTITHGPMPVPLARDMVAADRGFYVTHALGASAPHGWYLAFALLVSSGQDPLDPRYWISASFQAFLFIPSPAP